MTEENQDRFEFVFLRHGESVGNAEGYFQGQHDFPLTELGEEQAQKLAERWLAENVTFDKIITSPLLRASRTADIINNALKIPLESDPVWKERHNGMLAGVKHEDADERYSQPKFMTLYNLIGGTGESQWMLFLRAAQAVQYLLQRKPGRYLIVSHGGLLNCVMRVIFGIKEEANRQGIHFGFSNTAFVEAHYSPHDNDWQIIALNDHAHLPPVVEKDVPYTFTLLRHGESVGNIENRFQGQTEYPLTESGRGQAQKLAQRWEEEGIEFDGVFASPQSRAWDTANIIASRLGLEIKKHDALKEIDNGKMAGMKNEEIEAKLSDFEEYKNPYIPFGETGESLWAFYTRTGNFLQALLERPPGHYLVVSHGGTSSFLLFNMFGVHPGPHGSIPFLRFGNTGFARINYHPIKNRWRVLRMGDTTHLNPVLRSEK